MATTQINLSVDSSLKADVDEIFAAIGLTTTEAIRMFLRQTAVKRRLLLSVSEREINREFLPVIELSEDGYRNLAFAIQNAKPFEESFAQHKSEYGKFLQEHDIEVRE